MREERLISRASAAGAAMDASFLVQSGASLFGGPFLSSRLDRGGGPTFPFSSRSCCWWPFACVCLPAAFASRPADPAERA